MSSRTRTLFLALILGAFGWRVQGLANQSLWRDEVDAILFATRELPYTLDMFIHPGQNGALFFLALRPWFTLVGTSEFALRYVSAMAGTVSVALLWQVTARLTPVRPAVTIIKAENALPDLGRPSVEQSNIERLEIARRDDHDTHADASHGDWRAVAPFLAALFLASNPYQLWYSQEGKMYTVALALVLAAVLFFWRGITQGGWRSWLGFFGAITVAIYTHLLLILLYPLFFIWFIVAWPLSKRNWRGYSLAMAGLILPYLPMVVWQWDMLTANSKVTGFTFTPLMEMLRTLIYNHSRGFLPEPDLIWLTPVFFLFLAGLIFGAGELVGRRNDTGDNVEYFLAPWRRYTMLVVWLLAPIAMIHVMSLRQPIFTDRYIFWIAAPAMIFLTLGALVVWRHSGVLLRYTAVALVVYVVGFWLYAGLQQKTLPMKYDLRSGVTYVDENRSDDSLLILQIPHLHFAMRYYSSDFGPRPFTNSELRLHPWTEGLWTNNGWSDVDARALANEQMQDKVGEATDVWVVLSEVEMWDQRHLLQEWLVEHGEVVDAQDYHGIQVREYHLEPR